MQKPDLSLFPLSPGVYLYKDANGRILYVGKAVRLRNRIASYFRPEHALTLKTKLMLQHAVSIDILQTGTEKEALLLEASLIKKHRPRYNIVLRDDKEYLLFRIRGDQWFPRLEILRKSSLKSERTRNEAARKAPKNGQTGGTLVITGAGRVKDQFYGPFSSGGAARETWKLILKSFPLRRCRDRSFMNRSRPCLYHHMGQCLGPCVLPVSHEDYRALVKQVDLVLTGRSKDLMRSLEKDMYDASEAMEYEKAALLRDQLAAVKRTVERQSVVLPAQANIDLIGIAQVPEGLALGVVFVRDGLMLDGRNFFWPGLSMDETPELLTTFLPQYYLTGKITPPKRIVVPWLSPVLPSVSPSIPSGVDIDCADGTPEPFIHESKEDCPAGGSDTEERLPLVAGGGDEPDKAGPQEEGLLAVESEIALDISVIEAALSEAAGYPVHISTPRSADEDQLLVMAAANAREAAKVRLEVPLADKLQEALHADRPIHRVEIVDISHTAGRQTRAGMVVFENEQPVKNDYRVYALDNNLDAMGAERGDDYAALTAWARRRAKAGGPWPDLVLVDGGKGQLASVYRAFDEGGVIGEFTLASIAKARDDEGYADRRAGNISDRIFLPNRANPLPIRPGSAELLFLQRMRDTTHDYVIGRHRKARAKAALSGELTRLPGVGPKMARQLYDAFGSLEAMAAAGEKGLRELPGIGKEKASMLAKRLTLIVQSSEGKE